MSINEFEIEFDITTNEFEIDLESVVKEIYPELEDIEITPSGEEQNFKSEKYGYNNVKVKAVESEELNITPSRENQVKEGLYNKVTVAGDVNLVAENIKEGTSIFGVTGNVEEMTEEIKESVNEQKEIITTQEGMIEQINQVVQNKILIKEKYKPRYIKNQGSFFSEYDGNELNHETTMLDTTYFTRMDYMFYRCYNLISLDLSNFNTHNVDKMQFMFSECSSLTELDLSNFNTSNVIDMTKMFYNCSKLTSLDLSSFVTTNVINMYGMFDSCTKLKYLDIRNFTFDKVTTYTYIFYGIPTDCLIIVKSDTEKQWVLTQRSNFTNVKTVSELEE